MNMSILADERTVESLLMINPDLIKSTLKSIIDGLDGIADKDFFHSSF